MTAAVGFMLVLFFTNFLNQYFIVTITGQQLKNRAAIPRKIPTTCLLSASFQKKKKKSVLSRARQRAENVEKTPAVFFSPDTRSPRQGTRYPLNPVWPQDDSSYEVMPDDSTVLYHNIPAPCLLISAASHFAFPRR